MSLASPQTSRQENLLLNSVNSQFLSREGANILRGGINTAVKCLCMSQSCNDLVTQWSHESNECVASVITSSASCHRPHSKQTPGEKPLAIVVSAKNRRQLMFCRRRLAAFNAQMAPVAEHAQSFCRFVSLGRMLSGCQNQVVSYKLQTIPQANKSRCFLERITF